MPSTTNFDGTDENRGATDFYKSKGNEENVLVEPNSPEMFQSLDHPLNLEEVLVSPNAKNVEEIVDEINSGHSPAAQGSIVGNSVKLTS
jgi:hypothetical protein